MLRLLGSSLLRVAANHHHIAAAACSFAEARLVQLRNMADTYPGLPEQWNEDLKDETGAALSKR